MCGKKYYLFNLLGGLSMEILNNFSSIYCFIAFIIGAVFMLAMLSIAAMGKIKEPRNKVHFYVTKWENTPVLWFGKPQYNGDEFESNNINIKIIAYKSNFKYFGLNFKDFADMKEGEIREVFINLED